MKPKSIKFAAMTINEAGRQLATQLEQIYDRREASNIADLVMEHITGLKKVDRLVTTENTIDIGRFNHYAAALMKHTPVQYVLHEAWFCGMPLFVNEAVLIPRPETEELVHWVMSDNEGAAQLRVIDIGTGSGCIPIALKKKLPAATVWAADISEAALQVAERNAQSAGVHVQFFSIDILDTQEWKRIPEVDIIVSNPPYISLNEKSSMSENVMRYEPHGALFVPDDNPLLFYKAIAELGKQKLTPGGRIYVEINESFAAETAKALQSAGYHYVEIKKDLQGKERMIRACRY